MKLFIFGNKGQLGLDLIRAARKSGWSVTGGDLPGCDITDPQGVLKSLINAGEVHAVINAAAFTAVDHAESDVEAAFAVNEQGPGNLAQACRELRLPLIHISTDYVFNGMLTRPYLPSDPVDPICVYGRSKAAGEAAVRQALEQHVIVRTSWLFGLHGPNFVKTMLRVGKDRAKIRVVDDQIGSPTYAADLAAALLAVARHVVRHKRDWGTYHYCNRGAVTWYAFARRIFTVGRRHDLFAVRDIDPILTAQYPLPAPRPHYSVLDCTSFEQTFNVTRRPWEEALDEMIEALYPPED